MPCNTGLTCATTLLLAWIAAGEVSSTAASEPTICAPVAVLDEPPEADEAERAAAPLAFARGASSASSAHTSTAALRLPWRLRHVSSDAIFGAGLFKRCAAAR